MTEKLLEAEKKKLTQLELQLVEESGSGISGVEKVSLSEDKRIKGAKFQTNLCCCIGRGENKIIWLYQLS